ncbi:hypothetical protein [Candidatus Solirubrobacter pratensis]|uniref:hypothetical protein n=1 Tax=Candidatus Solirubrobacter pratensis TaxID=1298857 RepID=UPI0004231EEC|nr:hypothetical protein [Candidatus Solirubrobacter pratensis]
MASIAIDIDDTLYSFGDLARDTWSKLAIESGDKTLLRGAYCAWPEWRSPADVIDLSQWLEIIDRCHDNDAITTQEPYLGAYEGMWDIAEEFDSILYISTRKPEATEATATWLFDFCGFPPGDLICTHDSKIPYVRECRYIVDDRPKTLVQFAYDADWALLNPDTPRLGFGLLKEYNRALTDVPGIQLAPSWRLLIHTMMDKGALSSADLRY